MNLKDLKTIPFEVRDLTDVDQNKRVLEIASQLMTVPNLDIINLEKELCSDQEFVANASPIFLEAVKCAASRAMLLRHDSNIHVSVVWAMYQETERMKTREQHEHGEDFINQKLAQLKWLFKSTDHTWDMVACDDGCPAVPSSGDLATEIVCRYGILRNVDVIRLQDGIDSNQRISPAFDMLENTSQSRKGGAVLYAMWHAANKWKDRLHGRRHIIIYTDADLSANLAQSGALIHPILTEGKVAAVGHRYGAPRSVLVKKSGCTTEPASTLQQPGKHIILLRHFVRSKLIPSLENILDTQAGFKAFDSAVFMRTLLMMSSFHETFDVEMLINTARHSSPDSITAVPILFTEDLAMTNFPAASPSAGHLKMVQQIVETYERLASSQADVDLDFLEFFKNLDMDTFANLIENLKTQSDDMMNKKLFESSWTLDTLKQFAILDSGV